ncbi:MAG: DUF3488 and transglutaminase-like domain-containing protein [Deltaproteobacteria bacterium]|nr:DUF3488 and transglutaminase-like domain-containing protein [Deltaproteobacteria bacterium]
MKTFKKANPETIVKTLTYFSFVVVWVSLFGYVKKEFFLASGMLVLFSLYVDRKKLYPPRFILNLLSIGVLILALGWIKLENVVEQGIMAGLLLTGVKFLEYKTSRDYLQIYVLILVLLASRALLSLDIIFFVYVTFTIIFLSFSAVFLTFQREAPNIFLHTSLVKKIIICSVLIFLFSTFASFLLFFILPRTDYPLFNFLKGSSIAKTGIKDQLRLGDFNEVYEDKKVAFRVQMEKIDESNLYWRGWVLDYFDGEKWSRRNKSCARKPTYQGGRLIKQSFVFEMENPPYLISLEKPIYFMFDKVKEFQDHTFLLLNFKGERLKYTVLSEISDVISEEVTNIRDYVQVPKNIPQSIKKLVAELVNGSRSDLEKVRRIYEFLTSGEYRYSLKDLPIGNNALEKFLFENKKGNCEFFASAFVLMLRVANVPSRLVLGFVGGEYNEMGKYYIVRQKNAHTWAEVYIKGRGWIRFDPTVNLLAMNETYPGSTIIKMATLIFDTLNYYWTVHVVNYDLERQISLFYSIGHSLTNKKLQFKVDGKLIRLMILFGLFSGILFFCFFKAYNFLMIAPEASILRDFLKKMKKIGYDRKKSEGLEEFVGRIKDEKIKKEALVFVNKFQEIIYKDRRILKEEISQLKKVLKNLNES